MYCYCIGSSFGVYEAFSKRFEISQSELDSSIFNGTDLYRHIISNSHVNGYLAHRDLPTDLSDWNGLNGLITYFYDMCFGPVSGVAQHEFDKLFFFN